MKKALALLVVAALPLAGCSMLPGGGDHFEETFTDYASAESGWSNGTIPAWIPDEFSRVRSRAMNDGSAGIVEVLTDSAIVGDGCATAARAGSPDLGGVWEPADFPDEVMDCGDYQIIPVEGGWFGWYERASTQSASSE